MSQAPVVAAGPDYLSQGVQYLQEAKVDLAIQSFDQAIQQNPADPRPYMILGETYMRINAYDRAIDTFTAALRVAPNQGEIYYLLAVNYGLKGDVDLARKNAEISLQIFRQQQDEDNFRRALAFLQGLQNASQQ